MVGEEEERFEAHQVTYGQWDYLVASKLCLKIHFKDKF